MFEARGAKAGQDLFLAFSPERIDPGNQTFTVRNTPKVVGAITPACARLAALLYRQIVTTVIEVSRPVVAELAKLCEDTYRSVSIAVANDCGVLCRRLGVSSREAI